MVRLTSRTVTDCGSSSTCTRPAAISGCRNWCSEGLAGFALATAGVAGGGGGGAVAAARATLTGPCGGSAANSPKAMSDAPARERLKAR